MMRFLGALPLAGALLITPVGAKAPPSLSLRPQVMVFGVSHLVARHDVHNSVFSDSPLSLKRQAQVAEVVGRLAAFRPTKVLVESPMDDSKVLQQYQQYVAGTFSLPANEIYQFGFKLASRAGDSTIYPIDTWGPTLVNYDSPRGKRIAQFLETHTANVDDVPFNAYLAHSDHLERTGTYLDLLRYLNSDEAIRANASVYSIIAGMGRNADDAGLTYVSQWYSRNVSIFSNILSVVRPGDRVIVMMGQGHEYLLRDLVRLNPNLTNVDPLQYLK